MQSRIFVFLMLLAFVLVPSTLQAGSQRKNKSAVSFHIESDPSDNPKLIFPQLTNGKTRYFRRMPEISIKDIASFAPFPSDTGGDDYGVVFVLKPTGAERLNFISTASQGSWMVSIVNGRVVDGFLIDKPVGDGRIVIWKRVTLADINLLDKDLPRTGQEGKKKDKKKK